MNDPSLMRSSWRDYTVTEPAEQKKYFMPFAKADSGYVLQYCRVASLVALLVSCKVNNRHKI